MDTVVVVVWLNVGILTVNVALAAFQVGRWTGRRP